MKRQPARLPSARHSSSSADVWWISSTTRVSRAVMRPSSNQRRAIAVVTITTFQVGVSGVASRSRFTTPTLSGVCRVVVAVGRRASVWPVPVPATIPNPRPDAARREMSSPCSRARSVSMSRLIASSMVSQAARVGRSPRPARWRAPRRGRRSDRGEGSDRGKFARSQYRLAVEGEMIRRPVTCLVIVPWLAVAPLVALAQRLEHTPENPTREQVEAQLRYQTGRVTLSRGLATLDLPTDFRYLDPQETDIVLRAWGNPPGRETLGMLVPVGVQVLAPEGWGVIISFSEDGYVKDDDAAKIDYGELLRTMQQATREANPERAKAGYATVELVGWAEPPRYDSVAHKLYWAKDLKFTDDSAHTLNYNIRVLGRRGVLVLNAVASMDRLASVKRDMAKVMGFVEFNGGHRYADFIPGTDKVAEYGIAALIAGGLAAKAGLFKVLLGALIALKKFIALGLVAVRPPAIS